MDRILLALLFSLGLGVPALADGRVFPPDDCSTASPFMAFNATPDSNTYCINGQAVMRHAIPVCGSDQLVSYNGNHFYCRDIESNVPTCAPGEFLTYDGVTYICAAPTLPTPAPDPEPAMDVGSWCGFVAGSCNGGPVTYGKRIACNGEELTLSCTYGDGEIGKPMGGCPVGYYFVQTNNVNPAGWSSPMGACVKDNSSPPR